MILRVWYEGKNMKFMEEKGGTSVGGGGYEVRESRGLDEFGFGWFRFWFWEKSSNGGLRVEEWYC